MGALRALIREAIDPDCYGGSRPEESYDNEMSEDDAWNKKSVLVPDDVKEPINKWMVAMGLSRAKKKRSR